MVQQTVSTRLELVADQLKKEAASASKAVEDIGTDAQGTAAALEREFGKGEKAARSLDKRLEGLTGTDREILLRAEKGQVEQDIRQLERMLQDPKLTDAEIEIILQGHRKTVGDLETIQRELGDVEEAAEGVDRAFSGIDFGSLAGAGAGLAITTTLDDAATSTGRLAAQLGLTEDAAREVDAVAKEVFRNNYGDSMAAAGDVTAQLTRSLGLTGDELADTAFGVFGISDAFDTLGADANIITDDLRNMTANFPGLSERHALDLIADGFQNGAGDAGDLQDTLQEYPGDFARIGLDADDMLGILGSGMEAGARNTDIMADAVREMGIRISTAGDTGQEALRRMFPPEEAERLISDFAAGGDAGRDAFFTIADALTSVQDPQERYNLAVEIMGTRGEELANILPGMTDALADVRDGTEDVTGSTDLLNQQYTGFQNMLEGWKRTLQTSVIGPLGDALGPTAEAASGIGTLALAANAANINLRGMAGKIRPVATSLGKLSLAGAAVGATVWAVDTLGRTLSDAMRGAPESVDRLTLAIDGLSSTGEVPESVAGAFGGLEDAIERVANPQLTDNLWGPLNSPHADNAREKIENVDQALATLVSSGNIDGAADGFAYLTDMAAAQGVTVDELRAMFPGYAQALDAADVAAANAAEGAEGYDGALGGLMTGLDDTTGSQEELTAAVDEYLGRVQAATDPVFALVDALATVEDAQGAYNDAVDEYGPKSAEAETAAFDLAEAVAAAERAAVDGDLSYDEFRAELDRWVDQGAITADQAAIIAGRVDEARESAEDYEGGYNASLTANTASAHKRIRELKEALAGIHDRRVTVTVDQKYGTVVHMPGGGRVFEGRASGGPVAAGRTYMVGEEGPELVTFGTAGYVHDAASTAGMVAAPAGSASSSAGGRQGPVSFHLYDSDGALMGTMRGVADRQVAAAETSGGRFEARQLRGMA